ncbi:serine hydrolase domain-containing protein [Paraglaciecola psychrophila]|uniref:Beta-lactamase n=1 Tax=Paraglaciecola psychrophila 170 TaxID=1129794 RepID=K6YXC2_9ALTE|nr:serine hydrolase domain-containing protein [Paraglaciecola psychrophila]AGH43955.1 beta-lactamase [Paraglaciecola psychrophila 170]GAC37354.1 beta-lactamase [Paraglaciecola psychrophila 170]
MKFILSLMVCFTLMACQSTVVDAKNTANAAESVGFSSQRLDRIAPAMQRYIDQGKLAGTLTLVARNGKIVYLNAQGMQDKEAGIAMTEDTIFRIYSMTKPVTAVAAMTLWEQGKFHMFDPIAKYLPELANMKVYVSGSGDDMIVEDAKSPIRIIDLFMHTSGFSYGFSNSEVDKLYQKMLSKPDELNRDNILTKFAELPLTHQPGTAWNYGVSTDIIGFLVEKLSGKKLGEYMQETIFSPLGMKDTGFYVPADKVDRLTQIYTADKTGQTIVMEKEPVGDFMSDPKIHNAGGGLVSTMQDYFTFAQMMLNGGEINGVRILGRKTVEYMSSNHLPKNLIPYSKTSQGEGYGLAMSVTVDPEMTGFMTSKGDFGWGGAASTYFRVDPEEQILMISMAQFVPIGFHRYHDDFRNLVYQALID